MQTQSPFAPVWTWFFGKHSIRNIGLINQPHLSDAHRNTSAAGVQAGVHDQSPVLQSATHLPCPCQDLPPSKHLSQLSLPRGLGDLTSVDGVDGSGDGKDVCSQLASKNKAATGSAQGNAWHVCTANGHVCTIKWQSNTKTCTCMHMSCAVCTISTTSMAHVRLRVH